MVEKNQYNYQPKHKKQKQQYNNENCYKISKTFGAKILCVGGVRADKAMPWVITRTKIETQSFGKSFAACPAGSMKSLSAFEAKPRKHS